jgi:glycosyltransferase involved in cell wall biosynthesis
MARIAVELGVPASKVHVVPNGVDVDAFRPMPREEARRHLGLSSDGRLIVCVASLKLQKGIEDVLAAVASLSRPDVRLLFVGGPTTRGAYFHRLQRMVKEMGLHDRAAFAGVQPQERIPTYFNAADVSVLASHNEGCPNVVLESLACGIPVVATAVGAVPDIIRPGYNGELVPVRNPERLASALASALSASWSAEAIRASVSGRTWPQVAQHVMAVMAPLAEPTA